jgi:hypothetical protein
VQELSKRERRLIKARQLHLQLRGNHVQKKNVAVVDAFDVDVIRRLIHNFHVTQKTAAYFEYCTPSYSLKHQFQGRQNIFENNFEEAGVQVFKNTSKLICTTFFCFYLKISE